MWIQVLMNESYCVTTTDKETSFHKLDVSWKKEIYVQVIWALFITTVKLGSVNLSNYSSKDLFIYLSIYLSCYPSICPLFSYLYLVCQSIFVSTCSLYQPTYLPRIFMFICVCPVGYISACILLFIHIVPAFEIIVYFWPRI